MSDDLRNLDTDEFEAAVNAGRPVLVDFRAAWCLPCRAAGPILEAAARRWSGAVQFARLDVDEQPAVADRYRVRFVPTLVLFERGAELGRLVGAASGEALDGLLRTAAARDREP